MMRNVVLSTKYNIALLTLCTLLSSCGDTEIQDSGTQDTAVLTPAQLKQGDNAVTSEITVYDDRLQNGFMDFSWTSVDTTSTELRNSGPNSIAVTYDPWGGLYLVTDTPLALSDNTELRFWVYANDVGPVNIAVVESGSGNPTNDGVVFEPAVGEWTEISISMSAFDNPTVIDGIWWQEAAGSYRARIYFDDIRLVDVSDTPPAVDVEDETNADSTDNSSTDDVDGPGTDVDSDGESTPDDTAPVPDNNDDSDADNPETDDSGSDETDAHSPFSVNTVLFDDAPAEPLANWSWTPTDFTSQTNVHSGTTSIAVDYEPWGGMYLGSNASIPIPLNGELRLSVYAEGAGLLVVSLVGASGASGEGILIDPEPQQWTDVRLTLESLGSYSAISGLWIQEASGLAGSRTYFDDIRIVSNGSAPSAESGLSVTVNTGEAVLERKVINPASGEERTYQRVFPAAIDDDIYGINFAPNQLREELELPVSRWGGNATERYNFQTSSSNQGNDWYYANNATTIDAHHEFESGNQADGTASIMTLPALGWVSSDRTGSCSYPLEISGQQDSQINHWLSPNTPCGNGYRNGEFLGPVDPSLTSIAIDENFAAAWVAEMVSRHGTAAEGGVEMYAIGNEPGLWHYTHGDVRENPITRQEFFDLNIRYAEAVKQVDPTAEVLGPVLWGGSSYYVSADELLSGVRPRDVPIFLEEYLETMKQAGQQSGQRLLDRLAINFYDDRVFGGGTDALRLQSTRQLWDSSYAPADWWVVRDFLYGNGSAVIPRMQSLIEKHFPGIPMALTEYSFGGVDDGVGALAQMDVLGIFGREGLDMAALWEPYADYVTTPEAEFSDRPVFWAFRLYRNYDGNGSKFGNTALLTTSTDEDKVSAFAAERDDGAITIMLINKSVKPQRISLNGVVGTASVFRYDSNNPRAISPDTEVILVDSENNLELAARSATLLIVR